MGMKEKFAPGTPVLIMFKMWTSVRGRVAEITDDGICLNCVTREHVRDLGKFLESGEGDGYEKHTFSHDMEFYYCWGMIDAVVAWPHPLPVRPEKK